MRRTLGVRRADGFALIDLLFVCGIMGVLSCIALPRLLVARQSAGAASAIGSLRAINSSQLTFALTCAGGFYAPDLLTLAAPSIGTTEGFISPNLATSNAVTKSGYLVQTSSTAYAGSPATCNGMSAGTTGQAFKAAADALEAGNTRFFAINSNGQIWEHNASLFGIIPEAGEPTSGICSVNTSEYSTWGSGFSRSSGVSPQYVGYGFSRSGSGWTFRAPARYNPGTYVDQDDVGPSQEGPEDDRCHRS